MVAVWTAEHDEHCRALVERTVAGDRAGWQALLVRIAPHLEQWARGNRVLQRFRLIGDDDARAVMVAVLERLAADDHANLRRFLAHEPPDQTGDELVAAVVQLGRLDDEDEAPHTEPPGTPLRGWLLRLVDFVARDHVRIRFGWAAGGGRPSKRDLGSDAAPLSAVPEPGARPPMTDRLTVARLVEEIRSHIATFPDDMQRAIALWLEDRSPAEIAAALELPDVGRARALVRAGQARLRERFRGRSPLLFA